MIDKLLIKAKFELLNKFPFFGTLALQLGYREDETIPTACVSSTEIRYNPDFFAALTPQQRVGLLAHEVMHPALNHHTRREGRDPGVWNMACDYIINFMLTESGITLPSGALYNIEFRSMSAEQIYEKLIHDSNCKGKYILGHGTYDIDYFEGGDCSTEEARQNSILVNAAIMHPGKLGSALERLINKIRNPDIPYDVLLDRLLSERARDDYSWTRPNRNYIQQGLYVPSTWNLKHSSVVIAVDTSGSITQEDLENYASAVNTIHGIVSNTVHVIYCDAEIAHVDVFEPGDEVVMKIHGGGGTNFKPPFQYVHDNNIDTNLLIYFTDGECYQFPPEPEYDTFWLIKESRYRKDYNHIPFGEIIIFN